MDCQFIKERNLLPVFPERQHSIMGAHDNDIESGLLVEKQGAPYEYAIYRSGNTRFSTTKRMTEVELKSFKEFLLCPNADPKCKCFFLK